MTPAIEVEKLSKVYRISHEQRAAAGADTMRDMLMRAARRPLHPFGGRRMSHEQFWALQDIDLTVEPGEVVGLIGRNGSGKSTLLKVLSRIVEPTAGRVTMRGNVASLLEVGTGFHPELTGRENIYFNGALLGMTRREIVRKFDEIVAFSEVEQFLDTPVKFYSSGMYVRLAFAVAAHLEPDILIVDEVLAVGDSAFQKKSLGKMKDVSTHGRTVLFVSHSMASVKQLCDRSVLLSRGRVVTSGPTEEVIARYNDSMQDSYDNESIVTDSGRVDGVSINGISSLLHHVESGEPLRVELTYEPKERQRIVFGLGLRSVQEGALIAYTHSDLEAVRMHVDAAARFRFTLELPRIAPGEYVLELSMWANENYVLDSSPLGKVFIDPLVPFADGAVFSGFPSLLLVRSRWEQLT